jgi:hypothetical protein
MACPVESAHETSSESASTGCGNATASVMAGENSRLSRRAGNSAKVDAGSCDGVSVEDRPQWQARR